MTDDRQPTFFDIHGRKCTLCSGEFIPDNDRQELCGHCLKKAGMTAAAENQTRKALLQMMQSVARGEARMRGAISIEDVYPKVCAGLGKTLRQVVDILGPAAGSVFKGKAWAFTGQRVEATMLRTNHGRELKMWRLA